MKTLKQEIKLLKVGEEKIFKVDFEDEYITARKSKLFGLQLFVGDATGEYCYEMCWDELRNNFKDFTVYDKSEIDY